MAKKYYRWNLAELEDMRAMWDEMDGGYLEFHRKGVGDVEGPALALVDEEGNLCGSYNFVHTCPNPLDPECPD